MSIPPIYFRISPGKSPGHPYNVLLGSSIIVLPDFGVYCIYYYVKMYVKI